MTRTVSVVGHGAAETVPDVMTVDLGVACRADTVARSLQDAGAAVANLVDVLADVGVPARDLQTSNRSVQPVFGEHGPGGAPIVGYTSSYAMSVTLRDLDRAPAVLTAAAQSGGDASRISGVSLSVADDAALQVAARDAAFDDARRKAEQYARLADARLGTVLSVDENSTPPSGAPRLAARAMAADMPIQPGSTSVTATVGVVFELVP